jgi:hypothetical protein
MKKRSLGSGPYDVFLSHAVQDRSLATLVKQRMEDFGLSVVLVSPLNWQGGLNAAEPVRRALHSSGVYVALLTPSYLVAQNLLIELGAAWIESLPVHLLVAGDGVGELPVFMRRFRVWPVDQLSELIAAIDKRKKPVAAKGA